MDRSLDLDMDAVAAFCRRHRVKELSVFGSTVRGDSLPGSDVDILVEFLPGARVGLFEFVQMQQELEEMVGRKVDLVDMAALRNPFRRREILRVREIIYAA